MASASGGTLTGRGTVRSVLRWRLGPRSLRLALLWVVAPAAVALIAWQPLQQQPLAGFDASWSAGLEMAAHNGLTFGRQVVFTYGPLGFLSISILWLAHLGEIATAYTLALRLAFAFAVFVGARRTFGGLVAFLIAVVVASIDSTTLEIVTFLIFAVWAVVAELDERPALLASLGAGAFAAMELLNKVSIGVSLAVMSAAFVVGLAGRRWRFAVAAIAGFAGSLIVCWTTVGQPVGALPTYLLNSARITSGYAPGVAIEALGLGWQYPAALGALALGLWAAWHTTAGSTARQRWGVALLWIAFWFFSFKEGFVRHDAPHAVGFFSAMVGGLLAFRWRGWWRLIALLGGAALVAIALKAQGVSLTTDVNPVANARAAITDLRNVYGASRRTAIISAGRDQIRSVEPIDARALALLGDHSVAVYPSEIALAWAYRLNWDPLPLLQSYNAWTSALDAIDASALASSRAPQRILYQAGPYVDDRVLSFDQGMTSRQILCRYHEIYVHGDLAVLARRRDRCSAPALIERVRARWGEPVPVPAPAADSLVSVRIDGVGVQGIESLESLLFKPHRRFVSLDGARPNRLVEDTATDGLPLRASPGTDYAPPFNIAVGARTIAVTKGAGGGGAGRPITFSFYTQTLAR